MHHGITVRCLAQWSTFRNHYHSRILLSPPRNTPFILSSFTGLPADHRLGGLDRDESVWLPVSWGRVIFLIASERSWLVAAPQLPLLNHPGSSCSTASFLWTIKGAGGPERHISIQGRTLLCSNRTFVILAFFQPWCQRNRWSPATVIPSW